MKHLHYTLLSFSLAVLLLGCSKSSNSDTPLVPEITAIIIEGTTSIHSIPIDNIDNPQLIGRISYSDETNSTTYNELDWESNDTSILTVHNGLLTPQANSGSATITASYRDELYSKNEQIVTIVPLTDINISSETLHITYAPDKNSTDANTSSTYTLMLNGNYGDGNSSTNISSNAFWSSSNVSVATVLSTGELTTIDAGESNITVSLFNELNTTLELNVTAP